MRAIRISSLVIAAIIVLDFMVVGRARHDFAAALMPALVGAIVAACVGWRDAASPTQRRLLAGCTCLLATGLVVSLLLSLGVQPSFQGTLLSILAAGAVMLAARAIRISRKRRQLHAIAQYLDG